MRSGWLMNLSDFNSVGLDLVAECAPISLLCGPRLGGVRKRAGATY